MLPWRRSKRRQCSSRKVDVSKRWMSEGNDRKVEVVDRKDRRNKMSCGKVVA